MSTASELRHLKPCIGLMVNILYLSNCRKRNNLFSYLHKAEKQFIYLKELYRPLVTEYQTERLVRWALILAVPRHIISKSSTVDLSTRIVWQPWIRAQRDTVLVIKYSILLTEHVNLHMDIFGKKKIMSRQKVIHRLFQIIESERRITILSVFNF